ncbi:MAG TPA: amidohydrolase [Myxococcales bacterium]|nr:amidohydrolase [Myxococcales bacterium]
MSDLLIVGTLHTMDPQKPLAQAALVRAGRFVRVGTREQCEREAREGLRFIELGEGCATPGIVDAHGHPALHGRGLEEIKLGSARSEQECVERTARYAQLVPTGQWVRGNGWDQNAWAARAFPDRVLLDAATPDHPVALLRVDVHALWCNERALQAAGVSAGTPDPPGGRILRRADGTPTGVFIDTAMDLVRRAIPRPTVDVAEANILRSLRALAALGITGVHDAAAEPEALEAYRRLARKDLLPLRVYAMIDGGSDLDEQIPLALNESELPNFVVRAVKFFADGALGSRGAALSEPYSDDPSQKGLLLSDPRALEENIVHAASAGLQPCVHCIGDQACTNVLQVFAKLPKALRPRAEHLQILKARDVPLLKKSGAIASMQPTHATSDGAWAEERLGHGTERQRGAYAWRQALDAGAVLAFGSDFPVESPDPRLGLAAAAGRKLANGVAWMPEQRVTRLEALKAFTAGAAYAEFAEARRGLIREGYDADLTVFGRDVMAVHVDELARVPIVATVVGGQVIYAGP